MYTGWLAHARTFLSKSANSFDLAFEDTAGKRFWARSAKKGTMRNACIFPRLSKFPSWSLMSGFADYFIVRSFFRSAAVFARKSSDWLPIATLGVIIDRRGAVHVPGNATPGPRSIAYASPDRE
jgi:hypothetical protein